MVHPPDNTPSHRVWGRVRGRGSKLRTCPNGHVLKHLLHGRHLHLDDSRVQSHRFSSNYASSSHAGVSQATAPAFSHVVVSSYCNAATSSGKFRTAPLCDVPVLVVVVLIAVLVL
jgi:hypothetical protein